MAEAREKLCKIVHILPICLNPEGIESVVWSVTKNEARQVKITNVPPGNYNVRVVDRDSIKIRSLPVVVEKHQKNLTSVLRWAD